MRSSLVVLLLALSVSAQAAPPPMPITQCGDAVPRHGHGLLMNDLDCTGFTGGIGGAAVTIGASGSLDLQGFTITGGRFGVGCWELCAGGMGACSNESGRCEITNGTVTGAEFTGISGDRVTVENVTASDNGESGVDGYRSARAIDSTLTGNGRDGISAWTVKVEGSTVTSNGIVGINGGKYSNRRYTKGVAARDSTVTGNGTAPECSDPVKNCVDVFSATRPKLHDVTCDTSGAPAFVSGCGGRHWCACAVN